MITTLPIPKNQDLEIEKKSLQMKSSSTWVVGKETKDYLIRNYGFDEKGIRSNTELFESAIKCFDSIGTAYKYAAHEAETDSLILVFGSFITVANMLQYLQRS